MAKRILFTTFGSLGDLHPYIAIALELKRRGYEVAIATSLHLREHIENAGLRFLHVRPDLSETDRAIVLRFLDPTHGPRHLLQFLFSSVRESFEDLSQVVKQADLLVTHPATFAGPAVAKVTAMPWVSTVLSPLSFVSMSDPPVMPQMPSLDLRRMPRLLSRSIIGLGKRSVYRWEICGQRSQSVWHIKIGRRRQKRVRGDRPGNRRPPAVSLQQVPMILLAILPN